MTAKAAAREQIAVQRYIFLFWASKLLALSPASGHPSASPSGLATPDANARLWRTITAILDGTIRKR
ncbi:hypothetical protein Forpi1262_v018881 [Fusarium oxysporum f. sp. raphani]|uniref:Uncharacterized protein n=1 Tax=Fusarium oxysporum f. sp. raphani TaxID=96318 RepID=A0A8J5NDI1_FUSOX|nr:hypothetical protein Forpi1262_v018881 [Fusarium oxysporum f. sp. raphani]